MSNHKTTENLTFHFLKSFFNKASFNNKTLLVKRTCYKCNGKGCYHYYDPILDMRGCYDYDDASEPESMPCCHCDAGFIYFKFSRLDELKNWIEEKIKCQDWTYNYSEDVEVINKEYFYQSIIQEFLWLLPEDFTKYILNQYQSNIDKNYITINLYQTKKPTTYKFSLEYYLI